MRVIILGSQGFVGQHLTAALQKTKHKIFAPNRKKLDLRDFVQIKKYFKKSRPDVVINSAAHTGSVHYVSKHAATVLDDNVQMSLNLYRALKTNNSKARVINLIANCSYPGDMGLQHEQDWLLGPVHESIFAFGNYKRILYYTAWSYHKQYAISSLNIILPGVFGPKDRTDPNRTHALNGIIMRMTRAQKRGDKTFEIWGTGKPVREWIYVDDVVRFLTGVLTLKQDLLYPVNLAQERGFSIKQIAEFTAKILRFKGKLTFNTKYQDGASKKILSNVKFKKLFPKFKFTDFETGLKKTVAYYKSVL
jgi:GDP-L-fucose synthase